MTTPATNALSFNLFVQQIGIMAVVQTQETGGVYSFVDPAMQGALPSILNYAEGRITRDIDPLASRTSKIYALTAGAPVFSVDPNDFQVVQTIEVVQTSDNTITGNVVNSVPVVPVSPEFIQNVYGGISSSGTPQYYAMYGSAYNSEQDTVTNVLFGPPPAFGFFIRVNGTQRQPSLYQNAVSGIADTEFTYISQWYPDLLIVASMIYVSGFQRNWAAASDDPQMAQTYETQYRALLAGAASQEDKRKQQASAWSSYGTPTSATPTR